MRFKFRVIKDPTSELDVFVIVTLHVIGITQVLGTLWMPAKAADDLGRILHHSSTVDFERES